MGGILVFRELRQNHVINCEEMNFDKIVGLKCEGKEWRDQICANNDI